MTWLLISLKNAAKCDNWYQLQNHSITESLNAKGARKDPFKRAIPCMPYLSVDPQYSLPFHLFWCLGFWVEKKWNRVFLYIGHALYWGSLRKRWCHLHIQSNLARFVSHLVVCMVFHDLLWKIEKAKVKTRRSSLFWNYNSKIHFRTDLSMAGLPAELKHITQRRKRKQPWFP